MDMEEDTEDEKVCSLCPQKTLASMNNEVLMTHF
jgi:hypothetical protein